jgi:O-antigen/teichoic acid export membrane protein
LSRTRSSFWNLVSGLIMSGGAMVVGMLTTPVLLRLLGDECLGAFRAATDWGGYLAFFGMGLAGALQSLFAGACSRRDAGATAGILAAGLWASVRVSALALAVGLVLVVASPWLIPVAPDRVADLRLGFAISLVPLLLGPLAVCRSLVEAAQRSYLVHLLLLVQSLLTAGLSVLLAWLGYGLWGQFLAAALASLPMPLALAWDALRRTPGVRAALGSAKDRDTLRAEMRRLSWANLAQQVCGRLSMCSDNIIISALMGPASVVPFVVSQRLVSLAGGQATSFGTATWASLAELYGQGKIDLLNLRLIELTRVSVVLTAAVVIPTAAFTPVFVALWVGSDYYAGDAVPWITAANGILVAILSLWGWLFGGTGLVRKMLPVNLAQTAVNVIVSLAATERLGLVGPLMGTLVANVGVSLWWLPILLRDCFDTPLRPLAGAVLRPLCVAAPYAVALQALACAYPPPGWLSLAGALSGSALAYLSLAWFLVFDPRERCAWRERFGLVLSRHPG